MTEQAAFEVVGRGGEWLWQLRDGDVHIAYPDKSFATPEEARDHVTRTRTAVAATVSEELYDHRTELDGRVSFELSRRDGLYAWELRAGGERLAVPAATFESRQAALESVGRVRELGVGAVSVLYGGSDEETERSPFAIGTKELKRSLSTLIGRGRRHREFLEQLDARIVVMGIRGKSSTTRRIADVFDRRGYDTLVKITGNRPHVLYNGDYVSLERRGPRVTLYENIKTFWRFIPELDSYTPEGVGVFENQGLTEYTTRMFNQRFVQPDVILLTNVRQDHQDTLGKTRQDIARSFARSVPKGVHVVSGEQHPRLHEYLEREVEKGGGTLEQVDVPERHASLIGSETVHGVNEVLEAFEMDPLPDDEIEAYLEAIQPEWTRIPGGRIFNAAEVNDIESTEAARRALAGEETVVPFVYLRGDRRSRTASFAKYVNTLVDRGLVDVVYAGGDYTGVFARNVDAPVEQYPPDADAGAVLDDLVGTGLPIVTMGNTVADFMRRFEAEIERRAREATHQTAAEPAEPWLSPEGAVPPEIASASEPEEVLVTAKPDSTATPEAERRPEADADPAAGSEAALTDGSEPTVLPALLRELEEHDLSEAEREALADALGLDAPRHTTVQLDHLQSEVAKLSAYTDAMEEFIDERGTASEAIDEVEADLGNVHDRLDGLERAVAETDRRQDAVEERVESLDDEVNDRIDAVADDLDDRIASVGTDVEALETDLRGGLADLRDRTADNEARIDRTRAQLGDLADQVDDSLRQLDGEIEANRDRLGLLLELERDRLVEEIQREAGQIEDLARLRNTLTLLRSSDDSADDAVGVDDSAPEKTRTAGTVDES